MNRRTIFNQLLSFFITLSLVAGAIPYKVFAHHTWSDITSSNIGNTGATVQGTIQLESNMNADAYHVDYTTDPGFASNIARRSGADHLVSSNGNITMTFHLTGLTDKTTYYFRFVFKPDAEAADHTSSWYSFTTTGDISVVKAYPAATSETLLSGFEISLVAEEDTFNSAITKDFIELNNFPPGTTVNSVVLTSKNVLIVKLDYNKTDFDEDYPNFTITIKEGGFTIAGSATSTSVYVQAYLEIEGYDKYTSLGRSFPSKIEVSGYNARNNELHINTTLHTNMEAGEQTATFHYFIDVFNEAGVKIGSFGTISAPKSVSAKTAGSQDLTLNDVVVPLTAPLTASYRIVVLVKEVTLA